jgi:hypothetical protein
MPFSDTRLTPHASRLTPHETTAEGCRKNYIISTAFTKYVKRKGRVSQNHSGLKMRSPAQAAADTRVITQYKPLLSFFTSSFT